MKNWKHEALKCNLTWEIHFTKLEYENWSQCHMIKLWINFNILMLFSYCMSGNNHHHNQIASTLIEIWNKTLLIQISIKYIIQVTFKYNFLKVHYGEPKAILHNPFWKF